MTEALDKAEAALAEWDAANARLVRIWYANHHHLADALRALMAEHRRLLEALEAMNASADILDEKIERLEDERRRVLAEPDEGVREAVAQVLHNAREEIYPVALSVRADRYYGQADALLREFNITKKGEGA